MQLFRRLVLAVLLPVSSLEASIDWQVKDYQTAVKEAAAAQKNIMLFWQSAECTPCIDVKEKVLPHKQVAADLGAFYLVKLSPDDKESKEWTKNFDLDSYPQMIAIDPKGREIETIVGFRAPASFLAFFRRVKAGTKNLVHRQTAAALPSMTDDQWARILANPLDKILLSPEDPSEIRGLLDKVPPSFIDERIGLALKWAKVKASLTPEEITALINLLDTSLKSVSDLSVIYFTFIYTLPGTMKALNPEAQGLLREFALKFLAEVRQNPEAYKLSAVDAAKSYVCERDLGVDFAPGTVKAIATELMMVRSKLLEGKDWTQIKGDIFGIIYVLSELKESVLAIETAQKALPLSSEQYLLREAIAGIMLESGDQKGALKELQEAFHQAPGDYSKITLARKSLEILVKDEACEPIWELTKEVLNYHHKLVTPNTLYRFHFAKFSDSLASWVNTPEKNAALLDLKATYSIGLGGQAGLLYDLEYFGTDKKSLQTEGQQVVLASAMPLVNDAATFRLNLSNLPGWKTYEAIKIQESGKPIAFSVVQGGVKTPLEPARFPKVTTYQGATGSYSGYERFYSFDFILPAQMKTPGYAQIEIDWTACSDLCLRGTTTLGAVISADKGLIFHNIYTISDKTASSSETQTSRGFYGLIAAMLLSLVIGGLGWRYLNRRTAS